MNLQNLNIPRTCAEMQQVFEVYYDSFYVEMVEVSNSNLNSHVQSYIDMLYILSKSNSSTPNIIRASFGVVALHRFGFQNFRELSLIFDRLIPQTDIEYVKFTSWCAGRLIHHPDIDQDRYVTHLFERLVGWTRANGRRARPLAAAYLLTALATNAGSSVVGFLPTFQTIVWNLVTHQSTQILQATANAVTKFTRAISRYRRSKLDDYMSFLEILSSKLLDFGSPIPEYAALIMYEHLIKSSPNYFLSKILALHSIITESVYDEPMLVEGAAFCTLCSLSLVDPKVFVEVIADDLFSQVSVVIYEFPKETVDSIALLCKTVPDFIETKIDELKGYIEDLNNEQDSILTLLTTLLNTFGTKCLPIEESVVNELVNAEMTQQYLQFFVSLAIEGGFHEKTPQLLTERITNELKTSTPIIALNLISQLPANVFTNKEQLSQDVIALNRSESTFTRAAISRALFNITHSEDPATTFNVIMRIIQHAINDNSSVVRVAILQVILDHCTEYLSSPQSFKYFRIFLNDNSANVRKITFQIFAKVSKQNPLLVASYTRYAIQDAFFIIRQANSIRDVAQYVDTLPYLINAAAPMIQTYSGGFIDICMTLLTNPIPKFVNFIEEDAYNTVLIGVIDSLALLAPLDPPQVAYYEDVFIPLVCDILLTNDNRRLSLSILKFFLALLTAPSSSAKHSYREKTPLLFSACSQFLAKTHSRKARIATLQALGAIGVLELHQRNHPPYGEKPENLDESLARQFYHPSRDTEKKELDESLLLQGSNSTTQYFMSVVASSLLEIFKNDSMKDYYDETVQALVQILQSPRMFMLGYYDAFVSRLLDVIENAENLDEIKMLLSHYSQLIINSTHNASPFLGRSLKFIHNRFCSEIAKQCLDVVLAFLQVVRDGFSPYAPKTICLLIDCLDEFKIRYEKLSIQVLSAFEILGVYSIDLLYLIIPSICKTIMNDDTLINVRIGGLETLIQLAKKVDTYPYFGPIIRALSYGIFNQDETTKKISTDLLYTLIQAQGNNFIESATPLIESLQEENRISNYLEILINEVCKSKCHKFTPLYDVPLQRRHSSYSVTSYFSSNSHSHPFSEDAIIGRVEISNIGAARQMDQWLRSLALALISNSPSDAIRACTNLVTSYYPLALKLFNPAFLSCWNEISEHGKQTIAESFRQLIIANENYESVMKILNDLIVFMNKIEKPLNIDPFDIVSACMRYGGAPLALKTQSMLFYQNPNDVRVIDTLIDIYVKIGDWPDALGVWKKCQSKESFVNQTNVLRSLKKWEQVEPIYERQYNSTHEFDPFLGMSQALGAMARWPELLQNFSIFKTLKSHQKRDVSIYFSEAALHSGRWDILEQTLQYAPEDSTRACTLKALNAVHKKDLRTVDDQIFYAFSLLASRPIRFWSENQRIQPKTLKHAQELIEISEMKKWLTEERDTKIIEEVWRERLRTAPRHFDLWFHLLANRARVINIRTEELIKFFLLKSSIFGTSIHINTFDLLFPNFDYAAAPDYQKICYVLAHRNSGEKTRAVAEMKTLTHEISSDLRYQCHFLYASWLIEDEDNEDSFTTLKISYDHLKIVMNSYKLDTEKKVEYSSNDEDNEEEDFASFHPPSSDAHQRYQPLTVDLNSPSVLEKVQKATEKFNNLIFPSHILKELNTDQSNIQLLRKWSDVNYSLLSIDSSNQKEYLENAFETLTEITKISPSFPDVVQLLNIFFEHGNDPKICESAKATIKNFAPKLLMQASPQILVQLSNPNESVATFLYDTVLSLLDQYYHDFIFSVIVMKKSSNQMRSDVAKKILEAFSNKHPKVYQEAELIRKSLLMAAVTWAEKVTQFISEAYDHYQRRRIDRMIASLNAIVDLVKKPKCEMHRNFLHKYGNSISELEKTLNIFNPAIKSTMLQLTQWCKQMQDSLSEELKQIRTIQLSSISQELHNKTNFSIAVPGTYRPGRYVNHILYFVGQLSVYMSKQQPKDVIVKGKDGNFYQYLLKGHEDLRLDDRIMHFFRLINSLIVSSSVFQQNAIVTTCVIPLSVRHGLVKWLPGTETLRAIVEQQRELHNRDTMEEFDLIDDYSNSQFDLMVPVQKMHVIKKVCEQVPDTDIANFFWLKAPDAESWLKQTINFAISTGMTSIVGYIIGLGDRHPSNLLIDRNSGRVIHIDFGDCFERASRRSLLPEVVPFRLTRMMVRALGPTGTEGNFRTSFINMSQLLRENKRVLVTILSIFVHEPLIDPDIAEELKVVKKAPKFLMPGMEPGKSFHPAADAGIQSSVEMRKRVIQKLTGNDFQYVEKLTVEDQASLLVKTATDPYNFARMYSGWCPFW